MTDLVNQLKDVPATFSSWDSCMSKAYCKWPVIAVIIIAGLVVLSILGCLCCCINVFHSCFKCFTCGYCCGCCAGCCRGGGGGGGSGRTRHKDDYQPMPSAYTGYQAPPANMAFHQNSSQYAATATFDASSKTKNGQLHEDALPAMPSWSNAQSKRVEDVSEPLAGHHDDMEMGRMYAPQPQGIMRGGYNHVPYTEPASPIHNAPYSHTYDSDLGSQQMGGHQPQQQLYDDYHNQPLSPKPPTYRSLAAPDTSYYHQPQQNPYAPQPLSPSPSDHYSHHQTYLEGTMHSSNPQSTRYEPTDYNSSYRQNASSPPPPSFHSQAQGVRPPSILSVGRKPVSNSYREV